MGFSFLKTLTVPLRTTLVSSVIAFAGLAIAMTVGAIGYPAYAKARESIHDLWADLAKQVAQTAVEQVLRYFQSAPITLKFIDGLVDEKGLGIDHLEGVLDICFRSMKENPDFAAVYYAKADGTFYAVYREKGELLGTRRIVLSAGNTKIENFRVGAGDRWMAAGEEKGSYDPRMRPFWQVGASHADGGWTDPYPFETVPGTGYTYVLPHEGPGGIEGMWAVDFKLDELDSFLQSLDVGRKGIVFILTNDAKTIADSVPVRVADAQEEGLKEAWGRFIQTGGKSGYLNAKDRIFYVERFPEESQIPWNLAAMIHEDDFLLPIRSHALHSLYFGLIPCFFFLIVTAFFFGAISRRLKEIAHEMEEAGNLSFQNVEPKRTLSRIREVNMMNMALKKMKLGLHSFSKYVPFDVVKMVVQSGKFPELGGEKREVTVLFADLAGFTSMAEKLKPDEIVESIGRFLDIATHEVHQEKGTVDKFMGDAVMALWNAPDLHEAHALGACKAALAMKKLSDADPLMKFKIGINTGEAMVGNFGSHERMDYTAIGDTVNIAARLEKIAKTYNVQILIGPDTAQAVMKELLVRPLDLVVLRGRTQSVVIYELLGSGDEAARKAVAVYSAGLDAYRARKFQEAGEKFEEANALFGGFDVPSRMLIAKSRSFQKHPPPENWNGTAVIEGLFSE